MGSRLTTTTSFQRVYFQLLQYSRQRPSFSANRTALMTKTDLSLPASFLRLVDFAAQFCFCCKFSFQQGVTLELLESGLTVGWFSWTNQNTLLRIATNAIASFCMIIDYVEWPLFVFAKVGKGRLLREVERFWNKKRAHVAVRPFSNKSQKTSKCGKNISAH